MDHYLIPDDGYADGGAPYSAEELASTCPACGGSGAELGVLGRLQWYRCRDCGMDFNQERTS
jgi:transposase-like protein